MRRFIREKQSFRTVGGGEGGSKSLTRFGIEHCRDNRMEQGVPGSTGGICDMLGYRGTASWLVGGWQSHAQCFADPL